MVFIVWVEAERVCSRIMWVWGVWVRCTGRQQRRACRANERPGGQH